MATTLYQPTNPFDRTGWEYKGFLDEIEDELPNQNYAIDDDADESHLEDELDSYTPIPVNTRQLYAAKKSKEFLLKQHLDQAREQALKEYIKLNPDSHNLKVRTTTLVTAKSEVTINFKAAYASFMSCLLDRNQSLKTQKAILEYVKRDTGIHTLTANFWSLPLKSFTIKAFNKRIQAEGLSLSLTGCTTLSDVRKACSAFFTRAKAEVKATVKVSISDDVLTIGNASYPIITSRVGKSTYKRVCVMIGGKKTWQRLDVFEHLVFNNKSKK